MLTVETIRKEFGDIRALKGITFSVAEGTIAAVIGPNGAGKTTLFNILVGVEKASNGRSYLDESILAEIPIKSLGFLPETPFFYPSFTPEETLQYDMTMRGIDLKASRWEELIERFRLDSFLTTKISTISQGMKKRVALACAFLGTPKIIILDEPLNGLDIQSVIALKEQLEIEKQRGAHILLSSHVLSFLDDLADTFFFLKQGEMVYTCDFRDGRAEDVYRELFLSST